MAQLLDVKILKIFVGEAARLHGSPLYDAIVNEARKRGMAGASVSRGFMGFGASTLLHTAKILRLAEDLPVIVEIVDTPPRIADFLPVVEAMVEEGSIVLQDGQAIFHLPLRIRDIMTTNVATVGPRTPLPAVVDLLLHREVKAVPVMANDRIVGIITGGDLLSRGKMPLRLDMQDRLPQDMRDAQLQDQTFAQKTAQDIMSSPVRTLNVKTTVSEALVLMADKDIKRLPVLADDGALLGIVSRSDVLATIGRAATVAEHLRILPAGAYSTAQDVMFSTVPLSGPKDSLSSVLAKLIASPLRQVMVVDETKFLLGTIRDQDLLQWFVRRNAPGLVARLIGVLTNRDDNSTVLGEAADEVMTPVPRTISPETPLTEVVRILVSTNDKRLVVADTDNRLLGMVDRDAVLKALAKPGE